MAEHTHVPAGREGSLDAPTRHPIDWRNPDFFDEESLFKELERVYDICHGCRRCFSLCNSFPLLFDAIDASPTGELDGVDRKVYWEVVDHCYLCDMCYMTKCPYVPPHPWNIDFPHLMLRAKAVQVPQGRDAAARQGAVRPPTSWARSPAFRWCRRSSTRSTRAASAAAAREDPRRASRGADARVPQRLRPQARGARRQAGPRGQGRRPRPGARWRSSPPATAIATSRTSTTDLAAVFRHNGIPVSVIPQERCCGMPKLELGDLESIEQAKNVNIPAMAAMVDQGYDIVAPIPSCVLMFKQELPLLFPDDPQVQKVKAAMFDPFEYLMLRHKAGLLRTDFAKQLGKVSYHVPCHLRVQNIGPQDPRRAEARARHRGRGDRALLGPQRHLRREARVPRHLDEDRQAGVQQGGSRRRPTTTPATARWPATRSSRG